MQRKEAKVRPGKATLEQPRQKLLKQREDVIQSLSSNVSTIQSTTGSDLRDTADRAMDTFNNAVSSALAENEGTEVDLIDLALDKINRGTYGFCESCNAPIPQARLEALPHVTLCVKCQRQLEERNGHYGNGHVPLPTFPDEDEEEFDSEAIGFK